YQVAVPRADAERGEEAVVALDRRVEPGRVHVHRGELPQCPAGLVGVAHPGAVQPADGDGLDRHAHADQPGEQQLGELVVAHPGEVPAGPQVGELLGDLGEAGEVVPTHEQHPAEGGDRLTDEL